MKEEFRTVGTIDITPTWQAMMPVLIAILQDSTDEGKRLATSELMRLARTVDASLDAYKTWKGETRE